MKAKRVRESLYEFERGRDPKRALGISNRAKIEEWFEQYAPKAIYEINEDFSIDVKGSLNLSFFNNLTSLPKDLTVEGYLSCSNSNLTSLPEGLTVGEYLNCSDNNLTSLPEDLTVGGSLICSHNNLTSLPENLKVGRDLYGIDNPFPEDIKKPEGVEGEMFL